MYVFIISLYYVLNSKLILNPRNTIHYSQFMYLTAEHRLPFLYRIGKNNVWNFSGVTGLKTNFVAF